MEIAQNFGDELVGGPAASIPCIAPSAAEWTQDVGQNVHGALVWGRSKRVQSDNLTTSVMMAVLKVDPDCQYTLSRVIDEAQRALSAQRKSRK
jgi:hypothetical protein